MFVHPGASALGASQALSHARNFIGRVVSDLIDHEQEQSMSTTQSEQAPVELHKLILSADKLRGLLPFDRYVFALTGHVFNDLMILQKLVSVSKPPSDLHPLDQDAAVGVTMFLFRTLLGKTYEAMDLLGSQKIASHLTTNYFSLVDGLEQRWNDAVVRFSALDWLREARNRHAFHYMKEGQWAPHITDDLCEGGSVVVGRTYGDTWFTWADAMASYPLMARVDPKQPFEGLGTMLEEAGRLLADLTNCLAQSLQAYMHEHLTDDDALSEPTSVDAPYFGQFRLPYFFAK
jgi:hypothetical protein